MTFVAGAVACVLFTDLVGSTELMARVGDAAFDALRNEHFNRLRQAIAHRGGTEIKNTGDGVLATFPSAVEALAAAVAAQQATEEQARRAELDLRLRVGLALGEVAVEGGDVFGTPVVEAARLVAAAQPGQILCTALVRAVAGSRAAVTFSDLGALELKGLPEPVLVCEVEWEPVASTPEVPLPALLSGGSRIFVGRDDDLARLRQLWKEVAAGERRTVMLGGEPGIGKTRLATELADGLHGEGALVLAGRCDEDLGVPYQPFVEALRHYVDHTPDPRLGRHAGELARLVPELRILVPGLAEPISADPETERYRLLDAVAGWLAEISRETPVLLVLDDLHWAAKPTVLLLRHVLRSPEPMRLLVVGTYRDTDIGRGDPLTDLLADLPRIGGAERLGVTGLDQADVAAFIERAAGHQLDAAAEELAVAVWRETEGNPFFTTEVLRHLAESGVIEFREDRWVVTRGPEDFGIPAGVRDVVGRRLSRLSPEANEVLACAAVIGLEFEPRVVQTAGGFSEGTVIAALEQAVATRLVVDVPGAAPRNRFAHALVRATLYDELTGARRVSLHRRVAEAIEAVHTARLDDHLPALAHHWGKATGVAEAGGRAMEYATRAGDRALTQLAHDEAALYYRQALDVQELTGGYDTSARLDLMIKLGEAQRRGGDPAHRDTLLGAGRLARELGDGAAAARAALANSRGFWSSVGRVDEDRVIALEAALELQGPEDGANRARLLATLAAEVTYGPDRTRTQSLSDEALQTARELHDSRTLAHVLMARGLFLGLDTARERFAESAELLALAEEHQDPLQQFLGAVIRLCAALEVGDPAEARRCLDRAREGAAVVGQPFARWVVALEDVLLALIDADFPTAERLIEHALELGTAAGQPDAKALSITALAYLLVEQGRGDEVGQLLHEISAAAPGMPSFRAQLAFSHWQAGRKEEARAQVAGLAEELEVLPREAGWSRCMAQLAMLSAELEDPSMARRLYGLLTPYAGLFISSGVLFSGAVDLHLGILATVVGQFDDAEAHFSAAHRMHEAAGAPAWLARTQLEWGRMLQKRGEPGRARPLFEQALATASRIGQGSVELRARAALENV